MLRKISAIISLGTAAVLAVGCAQGESAEPAPSDPVTTYTADGNDRLTGPTTGSPAKTVADFLRSRSF